VTAVTSLVAYLSSSFDISVQYGDALHILNPYHFHRRIAMKSYLQRAGVLIAVVAMFAGTARSQDLGTQLSQMGSEAAKGYTAPFLSGMGASLNTAFYHSADLHDILGFDVGIKIGMVSFTDEDKIYNFNMPGSISLNVPGFGTQTLVAGTHYPTTVEAPTFIGDKSNVTVQTLAGATIGGVPLPTQTVLLLPGGIDLPALPLPMPQAAIGLPFGLEVIGRFIPTISAGDAGKFNYTGFGLRYDVDQWLPLFPVDIAVHFATQSLNFKDGNDNDVFSASATAYGVEVSKKLIFITAYAGFQLESSTMSIADYTYTDAVTGATVPIQGFDVDGKNGSRITVGLRMLLLILNVHAEYSIASQPVIGIGAGLSIR